MNEANQTEVLIFLAMVAAPMAILGLVGMLRGYHMDLRVWRGGRNKHADDPDDDR